MPRHVSQKADTVYRNAKPEAAPYRIGDGGGLFMLVEPDGNKRWRWQYARPVTSKRNTLALGDYPTVTAATPVSPNTGTPDRERSAMSR